MSPDCLWQNTSTQRQCRGRKEGAIGRSLLDPLYPIRPIRPARIETDEQYILQLVLG